MIVPDDEAAEWWARSIQVGTLVLQECHECGQTRFPPRPTCLHCGSAEIVWKQIQGVGHLHSSTTVHRVLHPALGDETPYDVALVDLPEGLRIAARLSHLCQGSVGEPVRITVTDRGHGNRPAPLITAMPDDIGASE
jgi:uncharacterized protein